LSKKAAWQRPFGPFERRGRNDARFAIEQAVVESMWVPVEIVRGKKS